jgi:LysM repeat protein
MNFKRLLFYLIINVVVSSVTILLVLNIWDRSHRSETAELEPVSMLPTVIASAVPPTNTPSPRPTLAVRPYEVGPGETLSEIAMVFGVSIDQLLEINNLDNPDDLRAGMTLQIPIQGSIAPENNDTSQDDAPVESESMPTATPPPQPESNIIKILTIVGINDLATEHLQIQSLSPEALSLEGWRLETNDGQVYYFPKITLFEHGAVDLYTRAGINSVVALYWGRSTPIFQSGDRAVIYDAEGDVQAIYSIP